MKQTKWIVSIILLLSMGLLFACNSNSDKDTGETSNSDLENLNETGMPIVEEEISFNIFAPSNPDNTDWNEILIWDEYKDMTHIDVDWQQIPNESLDEKRNLALGGADLPDAFYAAQFSSMDLLKHGEQGVFIELNDLIDEYAPNLTKLMEENPEIRKAITFPNGKIYSFPGVGDPDFLSMHIGARPWFNEEWLDELDMSLPETTDEFYEYLQAVKENDLNGNGEDDEIPYGGSDIDGLIRWLRGSFGLAKQNNELIDLDPEDKDLRFIPTSDAYKEMLEYINKLYEEELISQNITSINDEQFHADGAEGLYGSTVWFEPAETFGEAGAAFTGGTALEGPHGDRSFSRGDLAGRLDGLVITSEANNPEALVRWMDFFYSDEGAKFQYMGIENETFVETSDGEYEYVDDITDSPNGLTVDQEIRKRLAWVGILPPGLMKQEYFYGSESSENSLEATEKLEPYLSEEIWPDFLYTEEENKVLLSTGVDIEKFVEEARDKFIVGDKPFSEWDDYVETLEK